MVGDTSGLTLLPAITLAQGRAVLKPSLPHPFPQATQGHPSMTEEGVRSLTGPPEGVLWGSCRSCSQLQEGSP